MTGGFCHLDAIWEKSLVHDAAMTTMSPTIPKSVEASTVRAGTGGRILILSPAGFILHYRGEGHGDRLGPLAKRILTMLLLEPLTGVELARRIGVRRQTAYKALWRLRRKGLVESRTAVGRNLAGTRILRRFYSLNPEKVSVPHPVAEPTSKQLELARKKAQTEGLRRERDGIITQLGFSLNPTRLIKTLLCLYGKE